LREILDASDDTAAFLQDVVAAVEGLYADSDSECTAGFEALDEAVQAFGEAEAE
jgi:hypothetical protein